MVHLKHFPKPLIIELAASSIYLNLYIIGAKGADLESDVFVLYYVGRFVVKHWSVE